MSKELPKTLYITWNGEDGSESFLDPSEDPGLLLGQNRTVTAGVYELKEKVKLVSKTTVEKIP